MIHLGQLSRAAQSRGPLKKSRLSKLINNNLYNQPGIITSQSNQVIDKYYLDPKVLTAIERGALEIKVFGNDSDQKEAQKGGTK